MSHGNRKDSDSHDVCTVDMDGDGDDDLLHTGHKNRNIAWYENPLR